MSRIDYQHDSIAEIMLKQRERIRALEEVVVRQADRLAEAEIRLLELEEGADEVLRAEKERLEDALIAFEHALAVRYAGDGLKSMAAGELLGVLGDIACYATSGVAPLWLKEAFAEMERLEGWGS